MSPSGGSSLPTTQPLNILMLHGFTQSGPLFHAKTKALEKNLQKAFPSVRLHYPTGPTRINKVDIPTFDGSNPAAERNGANDEDPDAWGWWRRKGEGASLTYEGIELGLARIADLLKSEGPFQGVIGFSQGGAAAGMVASLLEPGRLEAFRAAERKGGMSYPESFLDHGDSGEALIHPPLKFAVSYSGFAAPDVIPALQAFYEPKIKTPMLHFIGSMDTVVEESRSLRLVDACVDGRKEGRLVYHPGGHFVPSSQRQCISALISFIMESLAGNEASGGMNNGTGSVHQGVNHERQTPSLKGVDDLAVPF